MNSDGVAIILYNPFSKLTLLLHRKLHWEGWEYVKGHQENGEENEAVARREVKEETGLSISTLHDLKNPITFTVNGEKRTYTCFLGITNEEKPTLSPEHDAYRWVTFDEAKKLLTFPDQLPAVKQAETFTTTFL